MKTTFTTFSMAATLLITGCGKDLPITDIGDIGKDKTFSAKTFYDNVIKAMDGKTVGYGFSLAQDGTLFDSYGTGYARLAIDGPETKYDERTRQEIGNCSKTITAFAILKALESKGLDETAKIAPFLPGGWVLPAANKNLRFEDLLAHKSGLTNFGLHWTAIEKAVETPTTGIGKYHYDDANYVLCRILLGYILHDKDYIDNTYDPNWLTSFMYLQYVREQIFKPCGLVSWDKATFGPWDESATGINNLPRNMVRYYNFAQPAINGITRYYGIDVAGPRGLFLNPTEVTQIISAGEQGKIVSKQMVKDMKTKKLGFDNQVMGAHGAYVWKNGDWDNGAPNYCGYYTVIMCFPNNVQLVFHTNAQRTKIGNVQNVISKAYDEAWF